MVGKSETFIQDEIAERLEDYEFALRKHGIKTVLGAMSEALDGKYLIGTSAITSSAAFVGHPIVGLAAGASLIVGKVALTIANALLSFKEVERGTNSEISWVYEVKQIAGKQGVPNE